MNSDPVDYLGSKAASEALAIRIRQWWRKRGYLASVRVFQEKGLGDNKIWVVRLDNPQDATSITREGSIV